MALIIAQTFGVKQCKSVEKMVICHESKGRNKDAMEIEHVK